MGWRSTVTHSAKAGTAIGRRVYLGYWRVQIDKHCYFLHRLAWLHFYGSWPKACVHHINRDPGDNRIANLSDISTNENLSLREWDNPITPSVPPMVASGKWWTETKKQLKMKLPKEGFTCEEIRQRLRYDPDNGEFVWKDNSENSKPGILAGYINNNGYNIIALWGRRYMAHRLAWLYMTGDWPKDEIDHMNGCRADNRWTNLRAATSSENKWNRVVKKSAIAGLKGVSRHHSGKWVAEAKGGGRRIRKHGFATPQLAHEAYKQMIAELHGEFARSS